ncbi:hypothetical protein MPSEU_000817100 [Mayamaea pseudoterrestris]|nr:hypothetical protein MPSEU_000817100 [Mayamaea pseudoterrestris]
MPATSVAAVDSVKEAVFQAAADAGNLHEWILTSISTLLLKDKGKVSNNIVSSLTQEERDFLDKIVSLVFSRVDGDNDSSLASSSSSLHTLINVLWLLACNVNAGDSSKPSEDALTTTRNEQLATYMLQSIKSECIAKTDENLTQSVHDLLVAHMPAALLQSSGWIFQSSLLDKKLKLYNTQSNYKQVKYNILAEQSEGYSKYLALLNHECIFHTSTTSTDATLLKERVLTAIGTFQLDPVRCLDLLTDVLLWRQQQIDTETRQHGVKMTLTNLIVMMQACFQPLLCHLPDLLVFKLSAASDEKRQSSLFIVMAMLVEQKLLNAKQMVRVLLASSKLASVSEIYETIYKHIEQGLQTMGRIKLQNSSNTEADAEKQEQDMRHKQLLNELASSHAVRFLLELLRSDNKHGLALLSTGNVFDDDNEWSQLCFLLPETIGVAICDIIQQEIQQFLPPTRCGFDQSALAKDMTVDGDTDVEMHLENDASSLSLEEITAKISAPLDCIYGSGCIVLRPVLYTQLCRVIAHRLATMSDISDSVVHLIKSFLLPSLSLFSMNPTLAHEVWEMLRHLPYQTRYALYDSWRGKGLERAGLGDLNKPLWLIESEFKAGKDIRYALKRLSKDTIRDMSRHIAKVCHSHPLVVFTSILGQIESYDNLVQVMVDALRYVTPLGLDVLSCCILDRLSKNNADDRANRNRLKDDGVNVSQWLQSLEAFVGYFYKQFPFVDFQGILGYLVTRLKDGHVMELGLLRALLKTSAGWSFADYAPASSLSHTQLMGRSGSHLLKRETMSFGIVDHINQKSSREVRRVLQTDNVGVCLLILLAQVRHHIVFGKVKSDGHEKPIKLVAYLLDTCQVTIAMLLDFLSFPEGDGALTRSPIEVYTKALPSLKDLFSVHELDAATCWMLYRPVQHAKVTDSMTKGSLTSPDGTDLMLQTNAWDHITPDLFEAFYAHASYDIQCPEDIYKSEIHRLEKESERQAQQKPDPANAVPDDRAKEAAMRLSKDLAIHQEHVVHVRRVLESNRGSLLKMEDVSIDAMTTFLCSCIFPRCMQGPDDAIYCAQFVALLHVHDTPGFGTLCLYDSIITHMSRALFGLTEGEAANLSILLLEVWKNVSRWRYDEEAFNNEMAGRNGSFMPGGDGVVEVTFGKYEELYNKWHASVGAVLVGALKSSEYIHIRNCLIVLTRLVSVFPTRPGLGNKLIRTLEPLASEETNSFADIRAAAAAYSQQLVRARDDGVWREESTASVEARQRKQEAAVAARQKQAQLQMEEIKLESEKIGKELGPDRRRDDRRRVIGKPGEPVDHERRPAPTSGMELTNRMIETRVQGPSPRPDDGRSGRLNEPRRQGPSSRPDDGRSGPTVQDFATMAADASRNLGNRFQRPDEGHRRADGGGTKRSRPPSPEEGESAERVASKRSRLAPAAEVERSNIGNGRRRGRPGRRK